MGEADSSVLVAAAGGRGGGAERGVEGGERARAGATIAPRAGLCVAVVAWRLGVGGAVRAGGAARGGARCFVSSSPSGAARAAGEARLPPDARPTAAAAASPRPSREGERRRGLPGRRGEQVRARAAGAVGGSAEGAAAKPRRPGCRRLPPRLPPRACVVCSGVCGGVFQRLWP